MKQFLNKIFHFRKQKLFRNFGGEKNVKCTMFFILAIREWKIKAKGLF